MNFMWFLGQPWACLDALDNPRLGCEDCTRMKGATAVSIQGAESAHRQDSFPGISRAQLLLYVGLASVSMLFGASLVGHFITRAQVAAWRPVELPLGIWLSSLVLVALSLVLHRAEGSLRRNSFDSLSRALLLALCLSLLFLVIQSDNWRRVLLAAFATEQKSLSVYTFFLLTVLHALHVVAGIIPLGLVYRRSLEQFYSSSRCEGLRLLRQYWDFLLIVWFILLAALGLS